MIKDEYIIDVPDMRHGVHQSFVSLRLIVWKLKVIIVDNRPVQNCIFWGPKLTKQYFEASVLTKQIQTKLNILKSKLTISNKYK